MATIFYRLTADGTYLGSNWNNVWHFRTNDTDAPSALELVTIFDTEWTNALKAFMNVLCTINSYYAIQVSDYGDYQSINVDEDGTIGTSATALPAAYASCFTGNTIGSPIRHAYKRFIGVDESMVQQGNLATGFVSAADVITAKYSSDLFGVTATYEPVVVRYNTANPPQVTLAAKIAIANFRNFRTQRSRIQ